MIDLTVIVSILINGREQPHQDFGPRLGSIFCLCVRWRDIGTQEMLDMGSISTRFSSFHIYSFDLLLCVGEFVYGSEPANLVEFQDQMHFTGRLGVIVKNLDINIIP